MMKLNHIHQHLDTVMNKKQTQIVKKNNENPTEYRTTEEDSIADIHRHT